MSTVVHSIPVWLPQTETWVHTQVTTLPDTIENHVVCDRVENLEQFSLPNLRSSSELPLVARIRDRVARRSKLRRYPLLLKRTLRDTGAQILHSHFGDNGWRNCALAGRHLGGDSRRNSALAGRHLGGDSRRNSALAGRHPVRHIVTFYGYDVGYLPATDPRWSGRYQELFDRVDLVLCEGSHMAGQLIELGCPAERVRVHHLGIRTDRIPFRPRTRAVEEPLRILIASSFREKKGIPLALRAIGQLAGDIPIQVTIIGDANAERRNQLEKERILEELQRQQLGPHTRLLGYQPYEQLLEEALQHQIYLAPSITSSDGDTEGGAPVSLIEMAASGMLIISSRHCDIPEVIEDGRTGLLVEEGDVEGITSHIRWAAEHPAEWTPMLEAGRHRVERKYDAAVQGDRLAEIYASVLAS